MRPKKRIFIIDTNEDSQGVLRFLLQTHAFQVFAASSVEQARRDFECCAPELIVASFGTRGLQQLLGDLHKLNPFVPSLLLAQGSAKQPVSIVADATLFGSSCTSAQIIEMVKVMAARKRGPRPTLKQPVKSETPDVAAERWSA